MNQPYKIGSIYSYQETVGDKKIPFFWKATEQEDLISIDVYEEKTSFTNLCYKNGKTVKWTIKEEGVHDAIAKRVGNVIKITGIRFGKEIDEEIKIDNRPWYQPLSYSLGEFLESDAKTKSFWVIRADKLEVIALKAKKIGEEELEYDGKKVLTRKVEIRPDGFLSAFWFGTYWYRKSDNLFLRYQSVHGMPGTDETIVELIDSPADSDKS